MSKLKKGDLVMVMKTHCQESQCKGWIFSVQAIIHTQHVCTCCNTPFASEALAQMDRKWAFPLSYLRKIDPDQASDREREFDRLNRRQPEIA